MSELPIYNRKCDEELAALRAERDQLRVRVDELEEQLANTAISFSQMEEDMYQAQGELASLRASIVALADSWQRESDELGDGSDAGGTLAYCATGLRQLGEGNSAAAQEGL